MLLENHATNEGIISQRKIIQPIDIYFYGKTALQNDKFLQLFMKNYNTMTNILTFITT